MGMFREAVAWMGGFIGIQPGMFFLGLVVTSFNSRAVSGTCADVLRRRISIWVCYLIMNMICSALTTAHVRVLVETDAHSRALRMCRHANEKKEPKHGIACIPGWKGKVVRPCFCLDIVFSFGSSICAIVALYFSLKLQFGCISGPPEIILLAVVGVISVLVHGFFGWVAITQD